MRFRSEKNIIQRKNRSGGYTFLVRIRNGKGEASKSFNEKDYPSAKIAFETAVRFRDQALHDLEFGEIERRNNSTVKDMFESYLETTTDSYKTKVKHTHLFNKYISAKNKRIQELTRADVQTDLNRMVETASDDTISKVLSIYRNNIVGTALLNDIVTKDVTLGIRKPRSKAIKIKKSTVTDKETVERVKELILESVADHYNAHLICYLLDVLYYTGMRPAEALTLTKSDITRTGISITKELGSSIDDTNVVRRCKTPNSVRTIPIHPQLKPILDELIDYAKTDYLFKKSDGHYMDSTWVGNIIYRLCKADGIEFNMYRLRHNMATSLVTNNVDSKTTVELLGHANYDMSIYYANSNEELKKDAIKYVA